MIKKSLLSENLAKLLRTNKRLERQLSMIKALSNAVKDGIFLIDKQGYVIFANDYGRTLLGISDEGANIFKILPNLENDVLFAVETNRHVRREFELSYPEPKFLKANLVPFTAEEQSNDMLSLVLSDVTQDKKSTNELIESEKIASVLKLASGIAHELGNPLNSMSIHLQVVKRQLAKIEQSPAVEKIADSIGICNEEIGRLKNIIENFLNALRPIKPNLAELDPLKPLEETLNVLKEEIKNRDIKVSVACPVLPAILGDENLLKQLFFNIIKNSMEALENGGRISVLAKFSDDAVTISFADTGCGISPENIAHLFEPYFTTKEYGHGLGMMIIENIVKAHGGSISVNSKLNEGTVISVTLPRKDRQVRLLPN